MNGNENSTSPRWATDEHCSQLLIESVVGYAIYMVDLQGRIVSWNPGAQAIKGYASEEVLGRHFSIFFTEEDRAAAEPERELLSAIDGGVALEGWRVCKSGARFWASVAVTAIHEDGQVVGFAKITRDLTERREQEQTCLRLARAEEALRLRNEFFDSARRALDGMVASMRVHIQSLAGTVDSLAGSNVPAKLRVLEWGIDRLARSLDEVVALAEAAGDRLSRDLAPVAGKPRQS